MSDVSIKSGLRALLFLAAALLLSLSVGCRRQQDSPDREPVPHPRIVSLSPATTEALFALGLGSHLVGVSRFCDYPSEVAGLPRVGGIADVDVEAVLRLKPDLVVTPSVQLRARSALDKLKVETLVVDQETLPQILDSIWKIGVALDRADVATAWLTEMDSLFASVRDRAPAEDDSPTVLICVGRDTASLERLYVAGHGTFYAEILELTGAANAYRGNMPFPIVSAEGVVQMNPDIILDIIPEGPDGPRLSDSEALRQWSRLPGVRAVANGQVHVITETWAVRPGPRIGFLVERIARIVREAAGQSGSLHMQPAGDA